MLQNQIDTRANNFVASEDTAGLPRMGGIVSRGAR